MYEHVGFEVEHAAEEDTPGGLRIWRLVRPIAHEEASDAEVPTPA